MDYFRHVGPLLLGGAVTLCAQNPQVTPGVGGTPVGLETFATNGILVSGFTNQVPPTSILGSSIIVQPLTLGEAISSALQNNYSIQIATITPEIRRFELAGTYSAYEPGLEFQPQYSSITSPGGTRIVGGEPQVFPPSSVQRDSVTATFGGSAPWGMRYGLSSDIQHTSPSGREDTDGGWTASLTQPLLRNLWIDNVRRTIQLSKNNLKFSEWDLRRSILQTIFNVETAYYDLIAARENIKVARATLDTFNQLLRENKKRVEVGALAPLDEKKAEAEVARAVADLLRTEQAYAVSLNSIKNLMLQNFSATSSLVPDPVETLVALPATPNLAESWKKGLTLRPEIQQEKLNLEAHNINLKYYKNQMWPEVDLIGTYGHSAIGETYPRVLDDFQDDDNKRYSIAARIVIPLGNIGPRNQYKAEKASQAQGVLRYKQLEQTIMMDIDNAIKVLQSRFQEVEATRQARLFSQDALLAEQKKYENGKSTSYTVLQFQRDLTSARFQEISALAEYNKALAALAFNEGATLERHNLNISAQ